MRAKRKNFKNILEIIGIKSGRPERTTIDWNKLSDLMGNYFNQSIYVSTPNYSHRYQAYDQPLTARSYESTGMSYEQFYGNYTTVNATTGGPSNVTYTINCANPYINYIAAGN